ncbi:MAG: hypothetical protein ABEK50_13890, partial [bacterium]
MSSRNIRNSRSGTSLASGDERSFSILRFLGTIPGDPKDTGVSITRSVLRSYHGDRVTSNHTPIPRSNEFTLRTSCGLLLWIVLYRSPTVHRLCANTDETKGIFKDVASSR